MNPIFKTVYYHTYPTFSTPASKNYHVRLVVYSGGTCVSVPYNKTITLLAVPSLTFPSPGSICLNTGTIQLTAAETSGIAGTGIYSGDGVNSYRSFNPVTAGAGTHTITYVFTATDRCAESIIQKITVDFGSFDFKSCKDVKLLIVEDEPGLQDSIREYFTEAGNICEVAGDYPAALQKVSLYRYDCIILDINLPQGDGLNIIRVIKAGRYPDGILIISARNALDDRLTGLDMGADDYLIKPFHLSELRARVTAIIRRKSFDGNTCIRFNEITVDSQTQTVLICESPLKLTRKEYNLLLYFVVNKNKVISKNAIAEHLWGDAIDLTDNFDFIYSHIKNLRKKLLDAGSKDYIHASYGMGYKFAE